MVVLLAIDFPCRLLLDQIDGEDDPPLFCHQIPDRSIDPYDAVKTATFQAAEGGASHFVKLRSFFTAGPLAIGSARKVLRKFKIQTLPASHPRDSDFSKYY